MSNELPDNDREVKSSLTLKIQGVSKKGGRHRNQEAGS
jgi:hypothetical protein